MSVLSLIPVAIHLINLFVQYEPALEKDVKDILAIIDRIRNSVAKDEGVK
jgi:hypothetical protein